MAVLGVSLALRSFEYWVRQYRRTWRASVGATVLFPVFFLVSVGLGLGSLVDSAATPGVDGLRYVVFLGPGLLVATAMQTAVGESAYPVLSAIKWTRTYQAMLATPLGVLDVLLGHLLFVAARVALGSVLFLAVLTTFGAVTSPLALLVVPSAVLTGLAFATPVVAFVASRDDDQALPFVLRFVVTPLFLFGGVLFPVGRLPLLLRDVAYATPLWHGVALSRGLALGTVGPGPVLAHVAYLSAWVAVGGRLAARSFRRRLYV